jgi:hypothetical protein
MDADKASSTELDMELSLLILELLELPAAELAADVTGDIAELRGSA